MIPNSLAEDNTLAVHFVAGASTAALQAQIEHPWLITFQAQNSLAAARKLIQYNGMHTA
jgi:hypothetical protein